MPIVVQAVPGKPYGKTPRVCLQIQSGYRTGKLMEHSGTDSPMHWPSRSEAEKWARETGYTVGPGATSASTMLLVDLFETFSDFQFEHREISGADLVDDLGGWLRKHKAAVGSMAAPKSDPGAQALKGLFRLCRPLHSGNADVNGGELVESFGEWLRETQDLMASITDGPFVAKVARSPEGSQYWSERDGWGKLDDATAFFMAGPWGLTTDPLAEWEEVELAVALEAELEPRDETERPCA